MRMHVTSPLDCAVNYHNSQNGDLACNPFEPEDPWLSWKMGLRWAKRVSGAESEICKVMSFKASFVIKCMRVQATISH